VLIGVVGDVNATSQATEAELKIRAGQGHTLVLSGMLKEGLGIKMPTNPGNAVFDALRAAYEARTTLAFARCNGPIATSGTKGVKFDGLVTKFNEDEPIDGINMSDVQIYPTYSANAASTSTVTPIIVPTRFTV
jgi:hypothetical protein